MPSLRFLDNKDYYPFDVREFDHTKCFRLWSNGLLGPQVTSTFTGTVTAGGGHHTGNFLLSNNYLDAFSPARVVDIERSVEYSTNADPFFTLVGKAVGAGTVSRAWLSDRVTTINPKLVAGMFEMDSYARVRYRGGSSDHDFSPRVGYTPGHQTFDISDAAYNFTNCAGFTCSRAEQTWFAHTNANWAYDPGPPATETGVRNRVDTGIRVDEWHTLGVWINKAGDEVRYFIDGKCVHRVTGRENIPNKFTNPSFVEGSAFGNGLGCGVGIRGTGALAANTPRLDIAWCVSRVFMERP